MKYPKLTLVAQVLAALALLMAGGMKLVGEEASVQIFTRLEMEPTGRLMIGFIEITAAMLLLSPLAATGALLSAAVMCGAIIAHATFLGLEIQGDHGEHIFLLSMVLATSLFVLFSRRKELPIFGETF